MNTLGSQHFVPRLLLLLFGILCAATSALWIKGCETPPLMLAACRQLLAALILLPWAVKAVRGSKGQAVTACKASVLPGIALALHFGSWIAGARLTPVAHSSLIVNMSPVVMPFMLLFLAHERINRFEIAGTLLAMLGLLLLVGADFTISAEYFFGDVVCFSSMLLFTLYLVLARRHRGTGSIWLYVVPLYTVGGLCCLVAAPFAPGGLSLGGWPGISSILGLALICTVGGHSILNSSMRHLRGQVVSLINLSQFIFAGLLAWILLKEQPVTEFYLSALLIVVGAAVALYGMSRTVKE